MIRSFPQQLADAYNISQKTELKRIHNNVEIIVTIGMGGSGICGPILSASAHNNVRLPILSFRSYSVPKYINERCLVFAISYSGNTIETLVSLKELISAGHKNIILISSGGLIEDISKRYNLDYIKIPPGMPPRASLGYLLVPVIVSLGKLGLFIRYDETIDEIIRETESLKKEVDIDITTEGNIAKKTALEICGKLLVIYGAGEAMEVVAERWAGQVQENAKTLTFSRGFPELCHNQTIGWEDTANIAKHCAIISLEGEWEKGPMVDQREAFLEIVGEKVKNIIRLKLPGGGGLASIIRAIYLGDYVSIYLAGLNNVDACAIGGINKIKYRISQWIERYDILG
ncbi:MAG: SIS domain-containing protein [bacterium]